MSVTFTAIRTAVTRTVDIPGSPELNVANGNASCIISLLGAAEFCEWCVGSLNAKYAREQLRLSFAKDYTCDDTLSHEAVFGQVVRVVMCGRTKEQVQRYIDKLTEICDFAINHDGSLGWS